MSVKVAYRIMAVRERQPLVEDLLAKLGEPETSVFWDEERKGSLWNAKRIWSSYKDLNDGTTHICLLCDDADVVNDFKGAVQKCVENFPNAIWTFANRPQVRGDQRGKNTPYIKIWNCWIRGICCLMPVSLIDGWFAFYDSFSSYGFIPNVYVDMSGNVAAKRRALQQFKSEIEKFQERGTPFDDVALSRNLKYGHDTGGCYAEGYQLARSIIN